MIREILTQATTAWFTAYSQVCLSDWVVLVVLEVLVVP